MTVSRVDMGNWALRLLGASRIESLDEGSVSSDAVRDAFDNVLASALSSGRWPFARKQVTLAAISPAPAWGKTNHFRLPSDFVGLEPPFPESNDPDRDWEILGDELHTDDEAPLYLIYIGASDDPTLWHPAFRKYYAYELALDLVEILTESNTKKQLLEEGRDKSLREARRKNAYLRRPAKSPDTSWVRARRG